MYKACRNSIVTLKPVEGTINNENRSGVQDPLHAKFRCNMARVVDITNPVTGEKMKEDTSIWDEKFTYLQWVTTVSSYDKDINIVCGKGIHYFKTKEAAVSWFYGTYPCNAPDGSYTWWREDGSRESEGSYKNGNKEGTWTWWDSNGQKIEEGNIERSLREGKWYRWRSDGTERKSLYYKNGHLM